MQIQDRGGYIIQLFLWWITLGVHSGSNGKWTRNEDVFPINNVHIPLLCYMLVYQRVMFFVYFWIPTIDHTWMSRWKLGSKVRISGL